MANISASIGVWSAGKIYGRSLPPLSSFTLTMISKNKALMFGGYAENEHHSDLYLITYRDGVRNKSNPGHAV